MPICTGLVPSASPSLSCTCVAIWWGGGSPKAIGIVVGARIGSREARMSNRIPPFSAASLMQQSTGCPDVTIAMLDGAVNLRHAGLTKARITQREASRQVSAASLRHGTFVAGMLVGDRESGALGLCPSVRVLSMPIFGWHGESPASATTGHIARAIVHSVLLGARIVNLSAAWPATAKPHDSFLLMQALMLARGQGALVVTTSPQQKKIIGWEFDQPALVLVSEVTLHGNGDLSTDDKRVHVVGGPIRSLAPLAGTTHMKGPSICVALTTGLTALLWSVYPDLSAEAVTEALRGRVVTHGAA